MAADLFNIESAINAVNTLYRLYMKQENITGISITAVKKKDKEEGKQNNGIYGKV